jgi:hypothetical protein
MTSSAGLSRTSSMSFLYATPTTSARLPFTGFRSSFSARATLATTKAGIAVFTSPARSMNRVL